MARQAKDEYQRDYTVTEPRTNPKGYTEYKVTAKVRGKSLGEAACGLFKWSVAGSWVGGSCTAVPLRRGLGGGGQVYKGPFKKRVGGLLHKCPFKEAAGGCCAAAPLRGGPLCATL